MVGAENKKGKPNVLIPVLLVITTLAVAITVWSLFFRESQPVLAPDYAPQIEERNAETIPDDPGEKLDQPKGGGSVSLTYAKEVSIDLSDKKASLIFANPGKSNQDMVLQVVIQDQVIIQSGTLKPGNQVTSLDLLDGTAGKLAVGGYEGKFVVFFYDQSTGEKAVINTEIPISISVNE